MQGSKAPRVFVSYSHDSDKHAARVLDLANALRRDGCDVILHRYLHHGPEDGWPLWMDRNIRDADFVLMVCTAAYLRRVMGEEAGLGLRWEGKPIYNRIYHDKPSGSRFIPVLLAGAEPSQHSQPRSGAFLLPAHDIDLADPGFQALYRHLTGQPPTPRPGLGTITPHGFVDSACGWDRILQ